MGNPLSALDYNNISGFILYFHPDEHIRGVSDVNFIQMHQACLLLYTGCRGLVALSTEKTTDKNTNGKSKIRDFFCMQAVLLLQNADFRLHNCSVREGRLAKTAELRGH